MKVVILSKYNEKGPSSYYRQYQFLEKNNQKINIDIIPFWGEYYFKYIISKKGWRKYLFMIPGLLIGYVSRIFFILFKVKDYDIVKIEKDLMPGMPVIFEYYITNILKKHIIYEYDDAIFINDFPKGKVKKVTKLADSIIVGNKYLEEYARKYNKNVHVIPTGVSFEEYKKISLKKRSENSIPVIGWIGTSGGLKYVKKIENVFCELEKKGIKFELIIISDKDLDLDIKNKKFIKWKKNLAEYDMSNFDIGIMPLDEQPFSKYKCGFKIIQYIAMGIPVVASPVGINKDIINNFRTGFLPKSEAEWIKYLERLLKDTSLRSEISKKSYLELYKIFDIKNINSKYLDVYKSLNYK